jgi:hypothetical protein
MQRKPLRHVARCIAASHACRLTAAILWQIALFKDHMELLQMVAHKRGKLKKGGLPDLAGAAREILGDWCRPNHPARDTVSCGIPCRAGYRAPTGCHGLCAVVHRAVSRLDHALCAACCMLHFVCCILHVA